MIKILIFPNILFLIESDIQICFKHTKIIIFIVSDFIDGFVLGYRFNKLMIFS